MATVHRRPAAKRDLIAHFVYLAEKAGNATATRFLDEARISFEQLAEQPMIGMPLHPKNHALAGMRKWRVNRFDNYLIFYLPLPKGVSIVRVLHAAQNWWQLLGITG